MTTRSRYLVLLDLALLACITTTIIVSESQWKNYEPGLLRKTLYVPTCWKERARTKDANNVTKNSITCRRTRKSLLMITFMFKCATKFLLKIPGQLVLPPERSEEQGKCQYLHIHCRQQNRNTQSTDFLTHPIHNWITLHLRLGS